MAHGDYNCCAVCDCKLDYSNNARTKEVICQGCLLEIQLTGIGVVTPSQFNDYIKTTDRLTLIELLKKLKYRACYYGNDIDDSVRDKLEVEGYGDVNNIINPPKPKPTEAELELARLKADIQVNLQIEMEVGELEPRAIIFQGKRYVLHEKDEVKG